MTTITAKIIADSISPEGIRLTTMQLRYPRFIHAEFMTHRAFSRNASSSRAVPVKKLIQDILDDPAMPLHWGKNQKGMQAEEESNQRVTLSTDEGDAHCSREFAWECAMKNALRFARAFDEAGYHKQVVNRLLEPFSHINVVVTATEWTNFFALRRHKDAEPHIQMLADRMFEAMVESKPELLRPGDWHTPYIGEDDTYCVKIRDDIKRSVARCARVSYLTTEGRQPSLEEDLALYDRLVGAHPLHASPAEHQATPDTQHGINPNGHIDWDNPDLHGNLIGWCQYRKTLPHENITSFVDSKVHAA